MEHIRINTEGLPRTILIDISYRSESDLRQIQSDAQASEYRSSTSVRELLDSCRFDRRDYQFTKPQYKRLTPNYSCSVTSPTVILDP